MTLNNPMNEPQIKEKKRNLIPKCKCNIRVGECQFTVSLLAHVLNYNQFGMALNSFDMPFLSNATAKNKKKKNSLFVGRIFPIYVVNSYQLWTLFCLQHSIHNIITQ